MLNSFEHSLDRLSRSHFAEPLLHMRKIVLAVLILPERLTHALLPRDEGDIGVGKFIAHEPWSVTARAAAMFLFLLSQVSVQDTRYPIDFFNIARNGTGHLFRVILLEPDQLSIVWTLSRYLEVEPLLRMIRLWCSGSKTQPVLRVVALDEILDNGTGLPESDVRIGVVDGWQATVGIDGEVLRGFDMLELDSRVNVVRKAEFLEDYGDFGRIGTTLTPNLDGLDL